MASKQHGRRAANAKAKTPLTELSELLAANSGAFGRRAAVVAASGGLLTAAVMPAAGQGTDDEASVSAETEKQAPVEFKNQTPTIDAGGESEKDDQDSAVTVDTDVVTAEAAPKPKPKPKPKPEPEPEPKQETAAADESKDSDDSAKSSDSAGTGDEEPADSAEDKSKDEGANSGSGDVKVPDGSKAEQVLAIAKQYVGTPYVLGGTSPGGWDCSGYTAYVYGKVGVNLPRTSSAQKGAGQIVSASEAKAGDIIWSPGHVGIYAGDGMMYDAGNTRVNTSYRSVDWMTAQGAQYIRVL
ncbi:MULTISPECIES: C40 family peptidase [unclassified Brevibacterium]|uniref:C40 family peptidase n=1 Tax=unclassified Brevibacterium TaxID=2614124 RepID=UPI0010920348|nr:C40 family peptidase [Brevibacterium sp. S22]TGD30100.1 peptidoglycan endopeptidase [Brevibacterium sp. S22]